MGAMGSRILLDPFLILPVLAAAIHTGFNHPGFSTAAARSGLVTSAAEDDRVPYLCMAITAVVARIASDLNTSH